MSNEQKMVNTHWVPCSPEWIEAGGDCAAAPRICCEMGKGISHMHPAHQGDPVAWTTQRELDILKGGNIGSMYPNDVLTKIPVFLHQDSGEVERLRDQLAAWQSLAAERLDMIGLRDANLAEREALLRDLLQCNVGFDMRQRLEKSLVASAEPSAPTPECAICKDLGDECVTCEEQRKPSQAPVKHDEREEFEAWGETIWFSSCFERGDEGEYSGRGLNGAWMGWQARAALERKPAVPIEQHGTSSDKYKAELYDEVFELVAGLGYANVTTAVSTLRAERDQLQADLTARDERIDTLTGLLLRAWDHVNISDVDLIVQIKAAIPGIASERGFTPTITIPPGLGNYDGSDNGVD